MWIKLATEHISFQKAPARQRFGIPLQVFTRCSYEISIAGNCSSTIDIPNHRAYLHPNRASLCSDYKSTCMSAPDPKRRDTLVSKALSYLLRHGAEKEHLPIDPLGWVPVDAVLSHNRLKTHKATFEDLQRIVENNEKQRFRLKKDGEVWHICASQGHTLKTVVPELILLDKASMPSEVYHGTYTKKLSMIQESGLSRMARNHIHLTSNAPWSKLGIRASCNTLIYIDTHACIDDGYVFWRSANGVILCEGNAEGVIPPAYFKRIETVEKEPVKRGM